MEFTTYKISISGLNLHKIIAYMQEKHLYLTDVERIHHKLLICNISKSDYIKIKKSGALKHYKVKILKRYGLEGFFKTALTKIGLFTGIIIMLLTTINITSTIHSVSIYTQNHICQNGDKCIFNKKNISSLYDALASLGIKSGAKLNHIPSNIAVKTKLIFVEKKGVFDNVKILESKLPTNEVTTNLIAPHSGIVVKTDVTSGNLKVKIGDIVFKGDTLIENTGTPASGTVQLRAFYHENTIYNENQITYEKTGNVFYSNNLCFFGINLNSNKKPNFKLYETTEVQKYLSVNTLLPIKVHQTAYHELKMKETKVSFELKKEQIYKDLELKTRQLIPENAEIKNTKFTLKQEGSRFLITCYVETYLTLKI